MIVVITADKPDKRIFEAVEALKGEGTRFVIIDEGGGFEYAPVFMRLLEEYPDCVTVLHSGAPIGRGHALKTAFRHILNDHAPGECVLTLDHDLEKPPAAAKAVLREWESFRESIVIGSFRYTGKIPFGRDFGMKLRRSVFAVTSGARIYDIESGLRAFSADLIPELLDIKGESFDHETAILLYAQKRRIELREVEFETPYHTPPVKRTFRDSWLIYRMIFAFMLTSFSCSVIDYITVLTSNALLRKLPSAVIKGAATAAIPLFGMMFDTKLIALVIGRFIGSTCNFLLNRKVVFKSTGWFSMVKYFTLVICLLAANYLLIRLITGENGIPLWLAQPIVQTVLYPLNFLLQRKWVFAAPRTHNGNKK